MSTNRCCSGFGENNVDSIMAIARLTVASACGHPPFGRVRGLGLDGPSGQLPKNRCVHLPRMWSRIAQVDIAPTSFIMASFRYDGTWPTFKQ